MLILRHIFNANGPDSFLRSVLLLIGGTSFAHAITAVALPILTRLYTPADFSLLAVFSSLLSIISVAACLRLDVAIPMPEHDREAFKLLVLALASSLGISSVVAAIVVFFPSLVSEALGRADIEPYLWLLPIGILLAGSYSTLQNWFVRDKQFLLIARSRVVQSAACAGTQIGLAGVASTPIGLFVGHLLNTGSACVGLGYRLLCQERRKQYAKGLDWAGLKRTWCDYSRFPKYSTWEALCNSAAIQVPIIMVAALAAGPEAGYLLLAMSVMQAPMALFGTAIGQVYLSRAPQQYRDGRLGEFTAEILCGLIKAGVGPLLAAGILAPIIFGLIFGEGWARAGVLVAWMTPWFVMQFLAAPISMAIHVTGHQRAAFILQGFGLLLRVLMVWAAAQMSSRPVSEAYAISGFIFYLVYIFLILRSVKTDVKQFWKNALGGLNIVGAWVIVGIMLAAAGWYLLPGRVAG